jgi:hypothetical protein
MHGRRLRSAVAGLLVIALPGCTSLRLQHSIASQATTLTDLYYQQVLNNLAMFSVNPYLLPSHVRVRDGSAQIQDSGSLSAAGGFGWTQGSRVATGAPAVAGSRTIVEQWGISPVTEDIELRVLQVAYQRALGMPVLMDLDLLNDLARGLSKQTAETGDIDKWSEFLSINVYRQKFAEQFANKQCENLPQESPNEFVKNYINKMKSVLLLDHCAQASFVGTNSDSIILEQEYAADPTLTVREPLDPLVYPARGKDLPDGRQQVFFTPLAILTRKAVKDTQHELCEIRSGWFHVGTRADVPGNACYVGRYKDRYAWVCPDEIPALSAFTLAVLEFTDLIKERGVLTVVGGPRYTPAVGR